MADGPPSSLAGDAPETWFTPGRLLVLFCSMNMLIYMDRGVIASNGVNGAYTGDPSTDHGIQGDFELSDFRDGLLPAAFMVGLLVSSLIFAEASHKYNAMRLMGIGLAIWTAATAGCAVAFGFWSLLVCRMVVGVGEASFVSLAAPFIDDNAPPSKKSMWLASFYLCIPVGYALGYVLGGVVHGLLSMPGDWRVAFAAESAAMLPFVLLLLLVRRPIDLHGSKEGHMAGQPFKRRSSAEFLTDVWEVMQHKVYVANVAASTVYTAVLGTYSFWGPKAGCAVFELDPSIADLMFGGVTVLTGVVGTLVGGVVLDKIGSSIPNAMGLCAWATLVGCIFLGVAFAFAQQLWLFMTLFALGELAMFMVQAPGNAVVMWCVPPRARALAMSVLVIFIHVLGDVPGPPLVGALQEAIENWRVTMSSFTMVMLLSSAFYLAGRKISWREPDYRLEGPHHVDRRRGASAAAGQYHPLGTEDAEVAVED